MAVFLGKGCPGLLAQPGRFMQSSAKHQNDKRSAVAQQAARLLRAESRIRPQQEIKLQVERVVRGSTAPPRRCR